MHKHYNSKRKSIISELQEATTSPETFDWVRRGKESFQFINPPTVKDYIRFEENLKELIPLKLSECLNRQNQLILEQRKRKKIISQTRPEDRYFWDELNVNWFSEFEYIQSWIKYWLKLLDLIEGKNYKTVNGYSDSDIQRAREYPIENLLDEVKQAGGGKLKSRCPFHEESSPSFVIFTNDNSAYCFGCGVHFGNAIDYLMAKEKIDFKEAVRRVL